MWLPLGILQSIPSGGGSWLDGVSLWVKLVTLAIVVLASWVGYKINQELFKEGGVVERLNEHDQKHVATAKDLGDHERRIGKLEEWKDRRFLSGRDR
jgi:hypothetical protein